MLNIIYALGTYNAETNKLESVAFELQLTYKIYSPAKFTIPGQPYSRKIDSSQVVWERGFSDTDDGNRGLVTKLNVQ